MGSACTSVLCRASALGPLGQSRNGSLPADFERGLEMRRPMQDFHVLRTSSRVRDYSLGQGCAAFALYGKSLGIRQSSCAESPPPLPYLLSPFPVDICSATLVFRVCQVHFGRLDPSV